MHKADTAHGETVVQQRGHVVIAALIIVFREVFEAGLIIGIVLAVTRMVPHRNSMDRRRRAREACWPPASVAVFAGALSNSVRRHGAGAVQRRDPDHRRS